MTPVSSMSTRKCINVVTLCVIWIHDFLNRKIGKKKNISYTLNPETMIFFCWYFIHFSDSISIRQQCYNLLKCKRWFKCINILPCHGHLWHWHYEFSQFEHSNDFSKIYSDASQQNHQHFRLSSLKPIFVFFFCRFIDLMW